jgi:hypothetical protein
VFGEDKMTSIWQLVLKMLATSFLALLVVGILFPIISSVLAKTGMNTVLVKNKRISYFILALLIFSLPIIFSLITKQELWQVVFLYIRELMISVVIILTVWATWAFVENPKGTKQTILVTLLRILLNVKQKKSIIQSLFLEGGSLDFFAKEYWQLQDALGESIFNDCLNICGLGIQSPPTEQELMLYDVNSPEDNLFISIEDHFLGVSPEVALNGLANYDEASELSAILNIAKKNAEIANHHKVPNGR